MNYVIVDLETNGLMDFKLPADHPSQPYIASVAFISVNDEMEIEKEFTALIKPDGWTISPEITKITGLTMERNEAEGIPIVDALQVYIDAIGEGRISVAHNHQFDGKCLRAALRRNGLPDMFENTPNICTMRGLTDVCKIPPNGNRGGYKFPKLSEACVFFGMDNMGDHTAMADARACLALLRKMRDLEVMPEAKVHFAKVPPVREQKDDMA